MEEVVVESSAANLDQELKEVGFPRFFEDTGTPSRKRRRRSRSSSGESVLTSPPKENALKNVLSPDMSLPQGVSGSGTFQPEMGRAQETPFQPVLFEESAVVPTLQDVTFAEASVFAEPQLRDVSFEEASGAVPLEDVVLPEIIAPAMQPEASPPRRSSRLKRKQELLREQKQESARLDAAVIETEDIPGEEPAAKRVRDSLILNTEVIMSALEKEDKISRLHKATVKARSNEPIYSAKREMSDDEKLSQAKNKTSGLLFEDDQQYVLTYRGTTAEREIDKTFLVNRKKQRTVVMDFDGAISHPGMKAAMDMEISGFRRMKVYDEVKLSELQTDTNKVSTRWVLSTKTKPDGSIKCKARLVAHGFEDLEKGNICRDSPTASNATQRLVLQLLAEKQWIPRSWDFLSGFLQGKFLDRLVVIAPPPGYAAPGTAWVIKRPIYGLVSTPKSWYDALMDVCREEGFDTDVSDEGVMRLMNKSGDVLGILALHVDDALGGGTQALTNTMRKVGGRLQIGSEESAADKPEGFFYKGLRVRMFWHVSGPLSGKFVIILDGSDYLDSVEVMEIQGGDDSRLLNSSEITDFRSVVGCVGYMATAFIPMLSVETSMLGRARVNPTVREARKANVAVIFAKANQHELVFQPGVESLLVFADSAGPTERGTQGACLFCMADSNGEIISGFVHWESKKEKRFVAQQRLAGFWLVLVDLTPPFG